jgi:hypothetical protein
MLIQNKAKLHRDDIEKKMHSNGKKNNSDHSIFKIATYTYGSDAKKFLYLSQLKND